VTDQPPNRFDPDSTQGPPPPPRPVLPLEYGKTARGRGAFRARVFASCVGYIVISGAWFRYGARSRLPARTILGGWLAMTGALLILSLYLRVRHQRAGYGYGILMALGLAALLVGGVVLLIISVCGHGGRI
jgi:hypothetical protein